MNKKDLRQEMLKKREKLSLIEVKKKSLQINKQLLLFPAYDSAKIILTYLPIKNEPDTLPLIKNAWRQKKEVLIPVTQTTYKSLILSKLESLKELTKGNYGILEPKQEFLRPTTPHSVDLCLLPGLAFDHNGYRLGYGGGYFDRFLSSLRSDCLTIALAYDFQILDTIPRAEHDIPIDIIITESTIYICNN
ncbi:MAG: 5-formyltetrahydrofolate cyclo-ligase [Peptococcia bacterium]|jgi:5-formyltetrahydrofolate cyclo-ligase